MKKITLLLSTFITCASLFAQTIPNASFETWVNNTEANQTYELPQGWISGDLLTSAFDPNYNGVTVLKSTQSHSGTYAVKMDVSLLNGDTLTPTLASVGSLEEFLNTVFAGSEILGFPFNSRPANLQGYYKLNSIGNDSVSIEVQMTKWNPVSNASDLVGRTEFSITSNASAYSMFNIPLVYSTSDTPDTVNIGISIINETSGVHPGTTLYIDDLAFSGTATGINETSSVLSPIKFYPNPFSTSAKIAIDPSIELNNASISIVDLVGKKVWEQSNIKSHQLTIERGDLPDGLYFYKVLNNNAEIATGKFIIK